MLKVPSAEVLVIPQNSPAGFCLSVFREMVTSKPFTGFPWLSVTFP